MEQYLTEEKYTKIINELSTTIANFHVEAALLRVQYNEAIEYATNLQKELNELKSNTEKDQPLMKQEEIINE